jgi:hypothetical protein
VRSTEQMSEIVVVVSGCRTPEELTLISCFRKSGIEPKILNREEDLAFQLADSASGTYGKGNCRFTLGFPRVHIVMGSSRVVWSCCKPDQNQLKAALREFGNIRIELTPRDAPETEVSGIQMLGLINTPDIQDQATA